MLQSISNNTIAMLIAQRNTAKLQHIRHTSCKLSFLKFKTKKYSSNHQDYRHVLHQTIIVYTLFTLM